MAEESKVEPFSKGLEIVIIEKGDGKSYPKKNDLVIVKYKGSFHGGPKHNEEFDVCLDDTYKFKVGEEIKGWNKGIKKMSKGEKSMLKIPFRLAYGIDGNKDYQIPQYQDLLYYIELLDIIVKLPSGVDVDIIKPNSDNQAEYVQKGDKIMMSYIGTFHGGQNHGKIFEQSKGKYHEYIVGVGKLIRGLDQGLLKMKYGESAILQISGDFAYGKKGSKGMPPIPPNQDLQFQVKIASKN